jgi:hemerythrin superfamily protein
MYRIRPVSTARSLPRSHVGISGRAFGVNVVQRRFQSSSPRVSEPVKRDHHELEKCYNNMMVSKDLDTTKRWQNQFTWELARHSIAEEIVVYSAFERHLPNGEEMAEKDRSQRREACRSNAAWADCS